MNITIFKIIKRAAKLPGQTMTAGTRRDSACRWTLGAMVFSLALSFAQSASAQVSWGAAAGFALLTYDSSNVSDSAYQGGNIGVVNGTWKQSGGAETNLQEPEYVYFSSSANKTASSYPSVLTGTVNSSLLNSAWTAATNVSGT